MRSFVVPVALVLCLAAPHTHVAAQWRPDQTASTWDGDDDHESKRHHPGTPDSRKYSPQKPDAELRQLLVEIDQRQLEATVKKLVSFGTRHTLSSQDDPIRGIGAATNWVFQQLLASAAGSSGRMTVERQSFVQAPTPNVPMPTMITNLVATLRGALAPERIYVVSAHIDTRATNLLDATSDQPGADDDASGVAVVLELARVMAKRSPEATIVFTVVAGAEQGAFGSAFQAAQFKAAGADIQGMFNNDIVGSNAAQHGTWDGYEIRLFTEGVPTAETTADAGLRRIAGGENDGPSRQLGRFVKSVAENAHTDMTIWLINRRDRYTALAGDQVSYLRQGYPAARFTEPIENFAHQHQDVRVENGVRFGDLISFLDFRYLTRVVRVNAATLWSLAQGPATPKNLRFLSPLVPSNSIDLAWDEATEPDLAGYEVVWREMDDADWTHVISVGNVSSVSFPFFPKDNFLIGVRAVDTDGHHSPVAYPNIQ